MFYIWATSLELYSYAYIVIILKQENVVYAVELWHYGIKDTEMDIEKKLEFIKQSL